MLKKTIQFENPFTGETVTEDHYFHISKADLVEMEVEEHGQKYEKDGKKLTGMQARLQRIIDAEDGKAIMSELKDIIRRSYGKKDGDRFLKSSTIWAEFESTEAFSQLLFDLCTDAGAASDFMNGIIPKKLAEQVSKEVGERLGEAEKPSDASPEAREAQIATNQEALRERGVEPLRDPTGLTEETTPRVLTAVEISDMDAEELKAGLADGRYKLS